jgi:hypothetical protein
MSSLTDLIIAKLRETGEKPKTATGPSARGYQLYVQEAKMNGETPQPYEAWLKQAPALAAPIK